MFQMASIIWAFAILNISLAHNKSSSLYFFNQKWISGECFMGRQMYELRQSSVNCFSLREGWGSAENPCSFTPTSLHSSGSFPAAWAQPPVCWRGRNQGQTWLHFSNAVAGLLYSKGESWTGLLLSPLQQHQGGGWLRLAFLSFSQSRSPLHWQYPPFLLRKWFSFLQEQLLSLGNVWLFLCISTLRLK